MRPARHLDRSRLFAALLSGLVWLATLAGCAPQVRGPLATVAHPLVEGERSRRLMIMLPGIGDDAGDYARYGLVETARRFGLEADLLAVDAHYAYYARDEIVQRLYDEIIVPAREHYTEVWLVGVSLGGLGAIMTAQEHPEAIDGLVLLAPYLGPSHMSRTIVAEGGMRAWEPPPPPAAYEWDVSLWTWLKRYEAPDRDLPPLYIAYGRQDNLAVANALVAEILPRDHVIVTDGAHYWDTWAGLWAQMVERGLPQLRASPARWRASSGRPPASEPPHSLEESMETAAVMAAPAL